jgi:hypothetical protein
MAWHSFNLSRTTALLVATTQDAALCMTFPHLLVKAYPPRTVCETAEGVTSEEGGSGRLKCGTRIKRKTVWQSQNPLLFSRRLAGDFPRFVGRLCLDQKQLVLNICGIFPAFVQNASLTLNRLAFTTSA